MARTPPTAPQATLSQDGAFAHASVMVLTTVVSAVLFLLPWAVAKYGLPDIQAWIGRNVTR